MFLIPLFLASVNFVSATHTCFPTDPECGPTPINNCKVTQNTTFNPGVYNLDTGSKICASDIT
ncbi:MAG: hypothetical protein AABY07_02840, partial [Nanoarchaeota archaeon]